MASSVLKFDRTLSDEPVDWYQVRSVYRKLHADFQVLTRPFGIRISRELDQDLAHLIGAIDVVDRELDGIEGADQRKAFGVALLRYLRGSAFAVDHDSDSIELVSRIRVLRRIIVRRKIQASFCKTVEEILRNTEAKRQSMNASQMIGHLITEWRSTGHLTVLFLGNHSTPEFEKFFHLACEMMPAIDTIQDARSDYRKGQMKIRPSIGFYLKLVAVLGLPLPKLFYLFPARWSLFKYAISFFAEGLKGRN
jgi:hypothetical protein